MFMLSSLIPHHHSLKTFTGWADPDLSERGGREVEHAARLLLEGGYEIDVAFTSSKFDGLVWFG